MIKVNDKTTNESLKDLFLHTLPFHSEKQHHSVEIKVAFCFLNVTLLGGRSLQLRKHKSGRQKRRHSLSLLNRLRDAIFCYTVCVGYFAAGDIDPVTEIVIEIRRN